MLIIRISENNRKINFTSNSYSMAIIVKSRRDIVGLVETTADLANLFGRTGWLVVVRGAGIFEHVAAGPANGTTIFAGTNGFWSRAVNN